MLDYGYFLQPSIISLILVFFWIWVMVILVSCISDAPLSWYLLFFIHTDFNGEWCSGLDVGGLQYIWYLGIGLSVSLQCSFAWHKLMTAPLSKELKQNYNILIRRDDEVQVSLRLNWVAWLHVMVKFHGLRERELMFFWFCRRWSVFATRASRMARLTSVTVWSLWSTSIGSRERRPMVLQSLSAFTLQRWIAVFNGFLWF